MDTHVKIVGWLWILYGVVSILMVIPGLIIINWGNNIPNAQDALFITLGSVCFFLPGIIADFLAGYGVLNYKGWGRILAIIMAVINIIFMCVLILPAALGIYTLIIMFNQETKALFRDGFAAAKME